MINSILEYLLLVLKTTALQILILFGPLLVLAFMMHYVAGWNERLSTRLIGRSGYLYLFGWLGTSVHESGHALFALLFGHKIEEMKFFSPDPKSGSLGYVKHSWNRKNLYQTTGNFFIGMGPVLLGSLALFGIIFLLYGSLPVTYDLKAPASQLELASLSGYYFNLFLQQSGNFLRMVFTGADSAWWKTALLIYLLFSIGTSIRLSKPDVEGAAKGFFVAVLLLLVFNIATMWIGNFLLQSFTWLTGILAGFYLLILLSVVINLVFVGFLSFLVISKDSVVKESQ